MKVLIIDNEQNVRETLESLLRAFCREVIEIRQAEGVDSGLRLLERYTPELVFLDVELDDGTGMELLEKAGDIRFHVVFITAHNKYAIDAFRFSAIDFLLKPFDPLILVRAVEKAKNMVAGTRLNEQLKILVSSFENGGRESRKIVLKDNRSIYFVKISEIIRCESEGAYTTFVLETGERIVISKTIKEYEELLEPAGFVRPHQSHLVNLSKIKRFDKADGGLIIMNNGDSVPVSQRKRDSFLELLKTL